MQLTVIDVENAHKRCERPQLKKGSQEYADAKLNSLLLYGPKCMRCGRVGTLGFGTVVTDFHHIVRRREGKTWGGVDCVANIVPMCRVCHTDNPIRPMLIVKFSKLPQFKLFMERVNV